MLHGNPIKKQPDGIPLPLVFRKMGKASGGEVFSVKLCLGAVLMYGTAVVSGVISCGRVYGLTSSLRQRTYSVWDSFSLVEPAL